jgi:hypothetical protein
MPPAVTGTAALAGVPSAKLVKRRVVIPPGVRYPYDAREWAGALVIVEHGVVDLEWPTGVAAFATGSALWLADLPLLTIHASGPEPVVLVALTRRKAPEQ